jgi:MinD superfamily P-loop ATPase
MSKIIAIWGSPHSGKTTLSIKLANYIYEKYNAVVTVVFADMLTPSLPVLFPNKKSDEMYSIGTPLSKPDVLQNDVMKNIVTYKGKNNMGFLGFKDGENRHSYPTFKENKVDALFAILKSNVDIAIVDCSSNIQNTITASALKNADTVIRLATADLKGVSFFSSQLSLMNDPLYKLGEHIICLNKTENGTYEPISEATSYFKEVAFSFPYSSELVNQYMKGTLIEKISDRKVSFLVKALAEKAVK